MTCAGCRRVFTGRKRLYCTASCRGKNWWSRAKHRPQVQEARKKYYERNKEKILASSKQWEINNKERRRTNTRRYQVGLYGLTLEEYDAALSRQEGKCLICLKAMQPPVIDHDHNDNRVRGLLCRSCNQGLGLFKDNCYLLKQAIAYLEKGGPSDETYSV